MDKPLINGFLDELEKISEEIQAQQVLMRQKKVPQALQELKGKQQKSEFFQLLRGARKPTGPLRMKIRE